MNLDQVITHCLVFFKIFQYNILINMKKLILISSVLLCLVVPGFSQTGVFNEALLFSRTSFGGTGRMQALGGAHVSLGGDISSATINPAGLGFYNRSDLSITLGGRFQNADTRFNNNELTTASDGGVGLYNLGIVFKGNSPGEGKFRGWNFAISLDRINDFNEEIEYRGENNDNSIAFQWANDAFNINDDGLRGLEAAASRIFIINPRRIRDVLSNNSSDSVLIYDPINQVELVDDIQGFFSFPIQEETITRSGSQNQWNFSAGGNYNDKVYFGGGLGITSLRYEQDRTFREFDYEVLDDGLLVPLGPDTALGGLTLRENLNVSGVGVNGTFGLIVRPVDFLTFGVSYITPTFYTLNEESSFILTNVVNERINTFAENVIAPGTYEEASDILISNYSLRTPSKLNLGLTVFTGKYGFITGSVEIINYGSARITTNDFPEAADNEAIRDQFISTANYRIGGEFRLDSFRFRAGYAALTNPLTSDFRPIDNNSFSFGVGYKTKEYYLDLSVVNSTANSFSSPYTLPEEGSEIVVQNPELFSGSGPETATENRQTRIILTAGLTF